MNNRVYKIYKQQVIDNKHRWTGHQLLEIEKIYNNIDESFHCDHVINLSGLDLQILPNFSWISCYSFHCNQNYLKSLKGCPAKVYNNFSCVDNYLESLEYSPRRIPANFTCHRNPLLTLEGGPLFVGDDYTCPSPQFLEGLPKGAPKYIGGDLYVVANRHRAFELRIKKPKSVKGRFFA